MNPTAETLAIDAGPADEAVPCWRGWGIAIVLTSLAAWAVLIAAARLIVAAV